MEDTKPDQPRMIGMNISVPETLRDYVQTRVAQGFGSVSEYVRSLIRSDQETQLRTETESALAKGLAEGKLDPNLVSAVFERSPTYYPSSTAHLSGTAERLANALELQAMGLEMRAQRLQKNKNDEEYPGLTDTEHQDRLRQISDQEDTDQTIRVAPERLAKLKLRTNGSKN